MPNQTCRVRIIDESEEHKWDNYVSAHQDASPYHLYAWGKSVEETYKHKLYYLMAEEQDRVVGTLPLIHLRLPFLIDELTALPFCDVGNVLADNDSISNSLIKEALLLNSKLSAKNISLRGKISLSINLSKQIHPKQTNKVRMFLNLPGSSDELMQSFKSKLRSQIRKAEKNRLTFFWSKKSDIDDFYTVFATNMRDLGSPVHSRSWFQAILKNYDKNARLGLVSFEDNIVGGGIILSIGSKICIPWASTLRKYNNLAPNMLLYWNMLKFSADNHYREFDFGRSSEGEGTYRFKKQWGAKPIPLNWYTTNRFIENEKIKSEIKDLDSREKVAEIWSRLPLHLANFLGPKIRKYISL